MSLWVARRVWAAMLWLMRRRWIRRLQSASFQLVPAKIRPQVWRSVRAQNRWARRHGLTLLRFSFALFFGAILVTTAYLAVLSLHESGLLAPRR